MKFDALNPFVKHLKDAGPDHFAPIYALIAHEDVDRQEGTTRLIVELLGKEAQGIKVFDGDKLNIASIIEELHNVDMFSSKTVVLIENCDKILAQGQKLLLAYFEKPVKGSVLILSAPTLNRSTNFYKHASKIGVMLDIPEEKPWQKEQSILDRITKTVEKERKTITPSALSLLKQHLGTEAPLVKLELEKVFCYIGEKGEITAEDISAICSSVNVESAWQLGDAIFSFDIKGALRMTKGLLNDGVQIIELLRQIRSQVRTKMQICSILHTGGGAQDVSSKFPYMRGNILNRNIEMSKKFGLDRCRRGLIAIDDTELQVKSSTFNTDFLAEMLIVKLVST